MRAPAAPGRRESLRGAARLLGDPSPRVRTELRRVFLEAGRLGRPLLRRAERSEDAAARAHARSLLAELDRRAVLRRLLAHATGGRIDLESSLLLLARLDRPDLDARPYRRALDAMAERVRERAAKRSGLDRARTLVEVLAKDLGYRGRDEHLHHPGRIHLHRVIERKTGLPLALVAIHILVARRAGIHAAALPLPGHVMLKLEEDGRSIVVDPYHGGEPRSPNALLAYLAHHGLAYRPGWFREASDLRLFRRQVANLRRCHELFGRSRRVHEIDLLLEALDRRAEDERR